MNVVLVITIIVLACSAINGYKKGLVEEIVSLLALVVGILLVALIASAISNYLSKELSDMLIAIILFIALVIIMQIAKLVIASLKFITKIPVIRGVNKLAGLALGIGEGIIFVWIGFLLFDRFNFGGLGGQMLQQIEQNSFLTLLYQNNYLSFFLKLG